MTILQDLRGTEDHTIINQYFDSIDKLVALVMEGHGAQAKDEGLCETVLHLQDVSAGASTASCAGVLFAVRCAGLGGVFCVTWRVEAACVNLLQQLQCAD
jgi:hypothetical protein